MTRRRLATSVAGVVVVVLVSGCSSDSKDAETASILCTELRQLDNRIVDQVNASVEEINAVPEGERMDRILDGLDAIDAELLTWDRRIDVVEFPAIDERAELQQQLHSGVDAALATLDAQRIEFASASGPVADDDVQGLVGAWFNAVEKVFSVSEPEVFRFERTELKQAFLAEPDCRNVMQQFVND